MEKIYIFQGAEGYLPGFGSVKRGQEIKESAISEELRKGLGGTLVEKIPAAIKGAKND